MNAVIKHGSHKSRLDAQAERDLAMVARAQKASDKTPQPDVPSEDELALTFCASHPHHRYVAVWKKWLVFDGMRWSADAVLQVFDRIRSHVRTTIGDNDAPQARALRKAASIAGIEKLAQSDRRYAAAVDQWDTDIWLLNTPGGMVDLRTGTCMKHDPKQYCTKITASPPKSACPHWMKFLSDVSGGDKEYQAFLQRVAGYAATGSTREHALFFLYGSGGNGKGTFLNTLEYVLGDYATTAPMETFTESRGDRHPTELAMLRGARMVIAQETEEGRAWAESRLKSLTGGDRIQARFMRQDFFEFTPVFKLLIAGNHKPRLRNVDVAMRRRLHLLPFTKNFTGAKLDRNLGETLKAESDGIMQWVVDGARAYLADGLVPPKVVRDATAEYFDAEDLFGEWLGLKCDTGSEHWEPPAFLFRSYKSYAEAANERPGSQKAFNEKLAAAGFRSGRDYRGRYWSGLRLKLPGPDP